MSYALLSQEKRPMTSPSKPQAPADSSADGTHAGVSASYGCSVKELKELMTLRGHEGYQKLQDDYRPGGVLEICRRLRTSPVNGKTAVVT